MIQKRKWIKNFLECNINEQREPKSSKKMFHISFLYFGTRNFSINGTTISGKIWPRHFGKQCDSLSNPFLSRRQIPIQQVEIKGKCIKAIWSRSQNRGCVGKHKSHPFPYLIRFVQGGGGGQAPPLLVKRGALFSCNTPAHIVNYYYKLRANRPMFGRFWVVSFPPIQQIPRNIWLLYFGPNRKCLYNKLCTSFQKRPHFLLRPLGHEHKWGQRRREKPAYTQYQLI